MIVMMGVPPQMKKYKLNAKKGSECSIWLFPDPETLAIWLFDMEGDASELSSIDEATQMIVTSDDKVEIEWIGCSYSYNSAGKHTCFNLVKVVRASPPRPGSSRRGMVVSGYSGWICDDLLKLKNNVRTNGMIVKTLTEEDSQVAMPSDDHMLHKQVTDGVSKIMQSLNLPKV